MKEQRSLQERYAPNNACWGCGPANAEGLRIRSFPRGDEVVAEWKPEPRYEAFPGVLNGGIIGTLLDCHCNWAAAVSFDETCQRGSSAVHGDRGLHNQTPAADADGLSGFPFGKSCRVDK
jgi:hypothetical protein